MALRLSPYGSREVLVISVVAGVGAFLAGVYFLPLLPVVLLAGGLLLLFFRNPLRVTPDEPGLLVAPADGKVVSVEQIPGPEDAGGARWCVDIFLSVFNVHINRAPCTGEVESVVHRRGRYLNALRSEASRENESNEVCLRTSSGTRVCVRQIAGVLARRIVCDCRVGDRLKAGETFGMIKFGSRTQVSVRVKDVEGITVQPGDRVYAGVTVIGRMK